MSTDNCRGCQRYRQSKHGSFYSFTSDSGWSPKRAVFDTDALNRLVKESPRAAHTEDKTNPVLANAVSQHEIYEEHIVHVDHNEPGLLGWFTFTNDATGEAEKFHLYIDGHHRLAKRLQMGLNATFYVLTEEEMLSAFYKNELDYLASKGVFVLGITDEEFERLMS